MSNRFCRYPSKAHSSGQARVRIDGKTFYLGLFNSPASHAEYARLHTEWAAKRLFVPKVAEPHAMTIAELIEAWLRADPRGPEHGEVIRTCRAAVPLERLFGDTLAAEFTAPRLLALQDALISASWMTMGERGSKATSKTSSHGGKSQKSTKNTADIYDVNRFEPSKAMDSNCSNAMVSTPSKPWSRPYINAQIDRLRRMFRWAESVGHVKPGTWHHLKTVAPLKRNDKRIRNTSPRKPVDWQAQVVPSLKFMSPQVVAIVQTIYHVGSRPSVWLSS